MIVNGFSVDNKTVTLYGSSEKDAPLIVFNNFDGDGSGIVDRLKAQGLKFNFLNVGGLDWKNDTTPWFCPSPFKGQAPYLGNADGYLRLLTDVIMRRAGEYISGKPKFNVIAGYSLAGLLAAYAPYRTEVFDRVACMSASLWYPGINEFTAENQMKKRPDRAYFSLGDLEANVKDVTLKTVYDNTLLVVGRFAAAGVDVKFELNQGNHFHEVDERISKGLTAMLI
ncbi:MAG: alpha/beta hydrolase [Clostridia bacterium]|nr:alpha/beta hydrolase [Clostridia bacterium]